MTCTNDPSGFSSYIKESPHLIWNHNTHPIKSISDQQFIGELDKNSTIAIITYSHVVHAQTRLLAATLPLCVRKLRIYILAVIPAFPKYSQRPHLHTDIITPDSSPTLTL